MSKRDKKTIAKTHLLSLLLLNDYCLHYVCAHAKRRRGDKKMKIQQYVNWITLPPPLNKKLHTISFDNLRFVLTISHQLLSPGADRARGAERQRGKPDIFWSSSHQCHQSAQSITVGKNIQMQIHKKTIYTKVQLPYFPFLWLLYFIRVPITDLCANFAGL